MIEHIIESIILEESLKSAREYAEKESISQEIFDKFNALDATNTKKLIHQILKWYKVNTELSADDVLKTELNAFIKFSGGRIKDPIEKFKTYNEFKEFITPFLNLETKKDALEGQYKKVFENDKMLVVIPFTHKASCIYGAKTKWCTTAKTAEHFNRYQEQGNSIYYVINKKDTDENNPFHKMAVVVNKHGTITHCFDTFDSSGYTAQVKKWIENNGINPLSTIFKPAYDSETLLKLSMEKYKTLKEFHLNTNTYDVYKLIVQKNKLDEAFPLLTSMTVNLGVKVLPQIPSSVQKLKVLTYYGSTVVVTNFASINDENRKIKVSCDVQLPRKFTNVNKLDFTLVFHGNISYAFLDNNRLTPSTKAMMKSGFGNGLLKINTTNAWSVGMPMTEFSAAIKNEVGITSKKKKVTPKKKENN